MGFFGRQIWQFRVAGRRLYDELAAGYTSTTPVYALYEFSRDGRFAAYDWQVPWDFRGTWHLKRDGTVKAAPDRSVLSPGFYPSPHQTTDFELWTGVTWAGVYRPAPPPRR